MTGIGRERRKNRGSSGETEAKCEGAMTPDNNSTEGNRKGKETAGRISSEDRDPVMEIEVEHGTYGDSRQLMTLSGTQFHATH